MSVKAKIFLAEQRLSIQSDWFRTLSTAISSSPIAAIQDETLKAGHHITHTAEKDCSVILIPIVGAVSCSLLKHNAQTIDVGDLIVISLSAGEEITFANEYREELINYLHIWLDPLIIADGKHEFTLEGQLNQLIETLNSESLRIKIGKFDGRVDRTLVLSARTTFLFSFVIEGAFEFHERLLQPRDGLIVQGETQIEFEALSNDAIILIFEGRMRT
jgi:hypothetical protein